ncbi:23S rRNA (uracil(747)-C(5))-methyltransferase RlmC [uncultured Schumannella sp.]|uniref:23S rRNA (uracil(747)-C(5))-methyltransferase RlmC n=1 Tax=uncultured Schumannella sp. TaxID=1195956 RepID=UPI0025E901A7|nr:23S rRNA (uracil(747)-C(5))-methyltransferase RlmC [uncultured Schumannella sp.]
MQCSYFDAGVCRSCEFMGQPYVQQLAGKVATARAVLGEASGADAAEWLAPMASSEDGFRNKAKLVVGGTADAPTLGILDERQRGVDLRECGIHAPGLRAAVPAIADFIGLARLTPYDVPARTGELKHALLTEAPSGALMLRFILRSTESVSRIRKHLPSLQAALPRLEVVSVNLQPEHKAVLEGPDEQLLTEADSIGMRVGALELHLRPGGFFQTNTAIAEGMYTQAREWVDEAGPASVWDLYCGVGGFALHAAAPGRAVLGIESSEQAVLSARRTAAESGLDDVEFAVMDATAFAETAAAHPELVIVNPPRRGLGERLTTWLVASTVRTIIYSSCNVHSLERDLRALPGFVARRVRVFDMFPQTAHSEVMVLLERRGADL